MIFGPLGWAQCYGKVRTNEGKQEISKDHNYYLTENLQIFLYSAVLIEFMRNLKRLLIAKTKTRRSKPLIKLNIRFLKEGIHVGV